METIKAGCFLVNIENKTVALVYREKQKEMKSSLENLSYKDFDLMLEEMLKNEKKKCKREKDLEM